MSRVVVVVSCRLSFVVMCSVVVCCCMWLCCVCGCVCWWTAEEGRGVCIERVSVCAGTTPTCFIHVGLVPVHTETFWTRGF